jgi:hypothetical protein
MNRPDLDTGLNPMAAPLQLAAVTDRGDLAQTESAKLERLLTKLDEIDGLKPRWWSVLDLADRVEILQSAHNVIATIYGFDPSPVQAVKLPQNERGNFSRATEIIQINIKLVAGSDEIEPLKTLMHESRHAYQWHLVKHVLRGFGWHSDREWTLAQEWSDNVADYKNPERYGIQEYLDQPIEVDARSFAETVIKLWFGK